VKSHELDRIMNYFARKFCRKKIMVRNVGRLHAYESKKSVLEHTSTDKALLEVQLFE